MSDDREVGEVAGYIRVSTQQQKEDGAHESQREDIYEWAEEHGYSEAQVDLYEDLAVSGQSDDREQHEELMERYEDYDAIVVRELARFGRAPFSILRDIQQILESDTDFVSITEPFDSTSPHGKALMIIISAINGLYADIKREQAIKMVERRREQGKNIGRRKKLNETQLEQVYEWRENGLSYGTIADLVEIEMGIEIDDSTIYRYCREADVEPAAPA